MARELSSNWKQLQAQIQAESSPKPDGKTPNTLKRRASSKALASAAKKQKKPVVSKTAAASTSTTVTPRPPPSAAARARRVPADLAARMGAAQSSKVADPARTGPSPSLAAWAAENDVSAESLAEAYGLGLPGNAMLAEPEKENAGRTPGLDVGKYVALDCEMVGVGEGGYESVLARVSLVDFHGRQVYDSFVRPREKVTDWRTAVSGIAPRKMRLAREFEDVQAEVAELLQDRILIPVLQFVLELRDQLTHSIKDIRDTSKFPGFRRYGNGKKPALRKLAEEILKVEIQQGAHSSVEDAKVTMALFRRHKPAFDVDNTNRFPAFAPGARSAAKKPKKKKK
ncbi:RNA exonuclease 4 like protein [Verticillium longisporum]|uniref:RNA exonuclease 4 like protein n=1 Tax=Verticillium longisporum TaxID=100787 RepID=A0A8I3AK94_VERLO|nr:RNA exonuclease 4 like protein [Verticillium longisporum]